MSSTAASLSGTAAGRQGISTVGALGVCGLAILALLLAYRDTVLDIVGIWSRSETFAHGFLVVPVSLYLIWRARHDWLGIPARPAWWAAPLLLGLGFAWLVASITGIAVGQHLSLVLMLPMVVLLVMGSRFAWAIAFPLAFLVFAAPMGEELMPMLMDFTARFTVTMLRLTGIPVYVEGTFFSIPSGDWSVVEGCSGIRYLIASVTMGSLYAYLTYRKYWKRALFIAFSVVLPILANGFRAYMIVMIAHLSDMKLALGVDHFIYGWVFFGLVMLLMFWIGSFFADPDSPRPEQAEVAQAGTVPVVAAALLALAVAAPWPAIGQWMSAGPGGNATLRFEWPVPPPGWGEAESFTDWRPHYQKPLATRTLFLDDGKGPVAVHLVFYASGGEGELINSRNVMVPQKHEVWQQVGSGRRQRAGQPGELIEARLRSHGQRLLIERWYWLDGTETANDYVAKLIKAQARLSGRDPLSAAVLVFAPYQERNEEAALRARLDDFIDAWEPGLRQALAAAAIKRAPAE